MAGHTTTDNGGVSAHCVQRDPLVVVVFPALRAAFPLVKHGVGGLGEVTCRVVAQVEVGDAFGRGAAGTA